MLTLAQLKNEYMIWNACFGNGRNHNDIRFGQYIYNKWTVESNSSYVIEDASKVYELLAAILN